MAFLLDKKRAGIIRNIGIAANRYNTESLSADNIKFWDVLQYDCNIDSGKIQLKEGIDQKLHFHHSMLKDLNLPTLKEIEFKKIAGFILAKCVRNNLGGKIIFATRDRIRLLNNLKYSREYFYNS
jgi:hypothetical protein